MNGPHDCLFVKRPEDLETSAAAADDQHVDRMGEEIHLGNRPRNLVRSADSLHANGHNEHVGAAPSPPQHFKKVADRRAGRAGDKSDLPWKRWQRPLSILVEESLARQLLAELPQRLL